MKPYVQTIMQVLITQLHNNKANSIVCIGKNTFIFLQDCSAKKPLLLHKFRAVFYCVFQILYDSSAYQLKPINNVLPAFIFCPNLGIFLFISGVMKTVGDLAEVGGAEIGVTSVIEQLMPIILEMLLASTNYAKREVYDG